MKWPRIDIPARTFLDDFADWTYAHGELGCLVFTAAFVLGLLLFVVVLMIGFGALDSYLDRGRPTVTLYTDEWVATRSHVETRSEYNAALKMPTVRTVTVVDQWTRRS